MSDTRRGIRAAQTGMVINAGLAAVKLVAGIVGNTYALVADAVESGADVFASLLVWGGLAVAAQPADEDHPYGHGKAEAMAAFAVSFMLLGAAVGIAIEAVREADRAEAHAWSVRMERLWRAGPAVADDSSVSERRPGVVGGGVQSM